MSEVAMEFGVEERVGTAANKAVDIRQQRAHGAWQQRGASQRPAGCKPRRRRTGQRVGEWIHAAAGLHAAD
jgi:hypothetical protein